MSVFTIVKQVGKRTEEVMVLASSKMEAVLVALDEGDVLVKII